MPEGAGAWSSTVTCGGQMRSTMNSRLPASMEEIEARFRYRKEMLSKGKDQEPEGRSASRCPRRRTRGGALIRALRRRGARGIGDGYRGVEKE
jgi:hypothetical protein